MATDYGNRLEKAGKSKSLDTLKAECSAATAATKADYPAEAMRSAFTACANGVFDLTESTAVLPEPISYQILIGAVLCLSGDGRCAAYEKQLKR